MRARVIALGRRNAGDDAVGPAILDELRQRKLSMAIELVHAPDPTALLELVATTGPVVLVDALLSPPAGRVVELAPDDLELHARAPTSHGLGVGELLALAQLLAPQPTSTSLAIVAITIDPPRFHLGLSPAVAAAVPPAADRVLARLRAATARPG